MGIARTDTAFGETQSRDIGGRQRPLILLLVAFLGLGGLFTMWHLSRLQTQLNETAALQSAELYSEAISQFRTLYTSEVVETARSHGIVVSHDYDNQDGAIPLPATLSMLLGRRIGETGSGANTRLYSAYPFPWRKQESEKLFRDPFTNAAWQHWRETPESDEPFYRFEVVDGRYSLRYAVEIPIEISFNRGTTPYSVQISRTIQITPLIAIRTTIAPVASDANARQVTISITNEADRALNLATRVRLPGLPEQVVPMGRIESKATAPRRLRYIVRNLDRLPPERRIGEVLCEERGGQRLHARKTVILR